MSDAPLTVGSLFAGVGGFDLGLEAAGMEVEWQVEDDRWCRQILRRRWPDANLHEDVRDVGADELERVDLVCGGFPCQDVSVAGNREGLDGERSGLWHEFLRIADSLAPRWILVENVPGLLSSNGGRDFAVLLCGLTGFHPEVPEGGWRNSGYCEGAKRRAFWRVLDTQYFGPPQQRARVFVIADSGDAGPVGAPRLRDEGGVPRVRPDVLFEPESVSGHPPPEPARGRFAPADAGGRTGASVPERGVAGSDMRPPVYRKARRAQSSEDPESWRRATCSSTLDAIGHTARTATAVLEGATSRPPPPPDRYQRRPCPWPDGSEDEAIGFDGVVGALDVHDAQKWGSHQWVKQGKIVARRSGSEPPVPRRLTPRECERLQGFPDDWTAEGLDEEGHPTEISDTQRYRQMGNAVTVPVARWIGERIVREEERR